LVGILFRPYLNILDLVPPYNYDPIDIMFTELVHVLDDDL